jgi:hypothetical protein
VNSRDSQSLESLAAQASFVFTGVVGEVSTSGEQEGTAAKVRVEFIHDAPSLLAQHQGQVVDLVFHQSYEIAVGERRVFFANPLEFGPGLLLSGVGSVAAAGDPREFDDELIRVRDQEFEKALAERVTGSVAVVHGTVTALERVHSDEPEMSEHNPHWWVARVQVIEPLKGKTSDEMTVRFANSRDVAWSDAPKLHAGQEAILLLQDDRREGQQETLAVLAEGDVRAVSADELELVRRLAE